MIRLIKHTLPLFFIFLLFSKNIKGQLLWEISGNGLTESSYLFGTLHVKDKRAFEFNDSVFVKIESCDAFAMEILTSDETNKIFQDAFTLKDGKTLKDFYNEDDYQFIIEACKEKADVDVSDFQDLHPMGVEVGLGYMQMSEDMNFIVDDYLYEIAKKKNKKALSLESMQTQLDLLKKMPSDGLLNYLKNWDYYNAIVEEMILVYQVEDLKNILKVSLKNKSAKYYEKEMLLDRNVSMTDSIDAVVHRQSTFMAIGAAHLPGEDGVIELLKKKGYNLTPIIASKTQALPLVKEVDFSEWRSIENKKGGFFLRIPTDPKYETLNQSTEIGNLEITMATSEFLDDEKMSEFNISFVNYPIENINAEIFTENQLDQFYTNVLNGAMNSTNGELIKKNDVLLSGMDGKSIDVKLNGSVNLRMAVLLIKNRLYMMQVTTESSLQNNPSVDYFFDSFKITDEKWLLAEKFEWAFFESKEGRFSAKMFGKHSVTNMTNETEIGEMDLTFYTSEGKNVGGYNVATSVLCTDFPLEMANSDTMTVERISEFYLGTLEDTVSSGDFSLNNKKEVSLDGKLALRYSGTLPVEGETANLHAIMVLVKNRLYLLQHITINNESLEEEIAKFFDSFKLLKK